MNQMDLSAKTPDANGGILPPPPSYDQTTTEPPNLYQVIQLLEAVYQRHRYRSREFVTLLLGFSGLPQNHSGSVGLHKYDDLLISTLTSLTEHFEELRMDLRYFATDYGTHRRSYPNSPPDSPSRQPPPFVENNNIPELPAELLIQVHKLTTCVDKTFDKVSELNKRMKPVLFKRTEHIFHKNAGLSKGWQMVHHVEQNIEDWVKWMATLDARAVCLKIDLERTLAVGQPED